MGNIGIIIWFVVAMIVLNVAVIALTLGLKALRKVLRRRNARRRRELEAALDSTLDSGELDPSLRHLGGRDLDVLAGMMAEYLMALRGAERERVVVLASAAGITQRAFRRLNAPGRWRKAAAAETLGYFGGRECVAPLARLLSHPDETLRAVAARALARIGTPESVEALAKTLNDPSELTRLRMAENLERIGRPAVGPLLDVLGGGSAVEPGHPRGPVQAAQVLGQLRAPEARPALADVALRARDVDLRSKATQALGKIGYPEDIPKLLVAAEDEAWPVRAQAANALGMIGDVSSIPALKELTVDPEWWVRLNASRALANMGPAGERALAEILASEDGFARDRAAATLEERGITLRAVEELALPGERGAGARALIRGMVRAGAVRYLNRLAHTLPDKRLRDLLRQTMVEARDA
jgi:HEAT repeat protein/heme exporter protein D